MHPQHHMRPTADTSERVRSCGKLSPNQLQLCIENYFISHCQRPDFHPNEIAKAIGIALRQLNEHLIDFTGYSASAWIRKKRLEQAVALLLDEPDTPLKEIGMRCGFSDPTAFSRCFKHRYDVSPQGYRNMHQTSSENSSKIAFDKLEANKAFAAIQHLPLAQKALQHVVMHLEDMDYKVIHLAAHVCLSTSQLNRRMKAILGVTASEFIRYVRLYTAAEKLLEEVSSLADIAYETGFFDQAHFCRAFKQAFGCCASDYREKYLRQTASNPKKLADYRRKKWHQTKNDNSLRDPYN